jgi:hypothetical protein
MLQKGPGPSKVVFFLYGSHNELGRLIIDPRQGHYGSHPWTTALLDSNPFACTIGRNFVWWKYTSICSDYASLMFKLLLFTYYSLKHTTINHLTWFNCICSLLCCCELSYLHIIIYNQTYTHVTHVFFTCAQMVKPTYHFGCCGDMGCGNSWAAGTNGLRGLLLCLWMCVWAADFPILMLFHILLCELSMWVLCVCKWDGRWWCGRGLGGVCLYTCVCMCVQVRAVKHQPARVWVWSTSQRERVGVCVLGGVGERRMWVERCGCGCGCAAEQQKMSLCASVYIQTSVCMSCVGRVSETSVHSDRH